MQKGFFAISALLGALGFGVACAEPARADGTTAARAGGESARAGGASATTTPAPPARPHDRVRLLQPHDGQSVAGGSAAGRLLGRLPVGRVRGLTFVFVEAEPVVRQSPAGDLLFFADVRGRFDAGEGTARRTLLVQNQRVALSGGGSFVASFPLTAEAQAFRIRSIDLHGRAEEQSIVIEYTGWSRLSRAGKAQPVVTSSGGPETSIFFGLGYSRYRYQESGVGPFDESALVAKISFNRQLAKGSRFDLALNTFFTAAALSSDEPQARTVSFFGLNARLGYRTPLLTEPWRLSLMGGVYYVTTSTSDGTFGFQNLMGPQIYPSLRYKFSPSLSVSSYFKYSPVGSGLSLQFANRELDAGLALLTLVGGSVPLSFSFDYTSFSALIDGDQFQDSALSFGLSVGF